jgi:hypothetical protein
VYEQHFTVRQGARANYDQRSICLRAYATVRFVVNQTVRQDLAVKLCKQQTILLLK